MKVSMRVWFILVYLLLGMPYAQASDDDIPAIARPLYSQVEDPDILYRKAQCSRQHRAIGGP
jgi:hypothetical protein